MPHARSTSPLRRCATGKRRRSPIWAPRSSGLHASALTSSPPSAFVDYSGKRPSLIDPGSGERAFVELVCRRARRVESHVCLGDALPDLLGSHVLSPSPSAASTVRLRNIDVLDELGVRHFGVVGVEALDDARCQRRRELAAQLPKKLGRGNEYKSFERVLLAPGLERSDKLTSEAVLAAVFVRPGRVGLLATVLAIDFLNQLPGLRRIAGMKKACVTTVTDQDPRVLHGFL